MTVVMVVAPLVSDRVVLSVRGPDGAIRRAPGDRGPARALGSFRKPPWLAGVVRAGPAVRTRRGPAGRGPGRSAGCPPPGTSSAAHRVRARVPGIVGWCAPVRCRTSWCAREWSPPSAGAHGSGAHRVESTRCTASDDGRRAPDAEHRAVHSVDDARHRHHSQALECRTPSTAPRSARRPAPTTRDRARVMARGRVADAVLLGPGPTAAPTTKPALASPAGGTGSATSPELLSLRRRPAAEHGAGGAVNHRPGGRASPRSYGWCARRR